MIDFAVSEYLIIYTPIKSDRSTIYLLLILGGGMGWDHFILREMGMWTDLHGTGCPHPGAAVITVTINVKVSALLFLKFHYELEITLLKGPVRMDLVIKIYLSKGVNYTPH